MFWTRVESSNMLDAQTRFNNDPDVVNLSKSAMFTASAMNILNEQMGFRLSADADAGRLGDGTHLPMLSYSLVEYLMGLDLSDFDLLEIGGGDSTVFWTARARSVLTLETNAQWAEVVRRQATGATLEVVSQDTLEQSISALDRTFGIIVIDPAANRLACARVAPAKLDPGGFILLDNSDWFPNAAQTLRDAGLIQVDFHDFRPGKPYRATASLFLSPAFRPRPRGARLPLPPIGGKQVGGNFWDQD